MTDPADPAAPTEREPIDVSPRSSVWTLVRTARRECSPRESQPFLNSYYPHKYAADFMRLFPEAVPPAVVECHLRALVVALWLRLRGPVMPRAWWDAQLAEHWPPKRRDRAARAIMAWARFERRDYTELVTVLADAYLELRDIDRSRPSDVPPGPGSSPNEGFERMAEALRRMNGNAGVFHTDGAQFFTTDRSGQWRSFG